MNNILSLTEDTTPQLKRDIVGRRHSKHPQVQKVTT